MKDGVDQAVTGPLRLAAAMLLVAAMVLLAAATRLRPAGQWPTRLYPASVGAASLAILMMTFAEAVWFDLTSAVTLSAAGVTLVLASRRRHQVLTIRRNDTLQRLRRLRANHNR